MPRQQNTSKLYREWFGVSSLQRKQFEVPRGIPLFNRLYPQNRESENNHPQMERDPRFFKFMQLRRGGAKTRVAMIAIRAVRTGRCGDEKRLVYRSGAFTEGRTHTPVLPVCCSRGPEVFYHRNDRRPRRSRGFTSRFCSWSTFRSSVELCRLRASAACFRAGPTQDAPVAGQPEGAGGRGSIRICKSIRAPLHSERICTCATRARDE